jgi:hypothetical protein
MAAKKTAKKATAKRSDAKPEFGAKAVFIRKYRKLSAAEIVAKAAEAGISLTANHVYNTRALDKKNKGKTRRAAKAAGPAAKAKTATNGRRSTASSGASTATEAAFRNAIALMGLTRARELFAEVEAAIRGA